MNTTTFSDLLHWIQNDNTSIESVSKWVYGLIWNISPVPLGWERLSFIDIIRRIYTTPDKPFLRKKISDAIVLLFINADWNNDNLRYLDRLLFLVGYFNVADKNVTNKLNEFLFSQFLKKRSLNSSINLHNSLLSAIDSIGLDQNMMEYIMRDIRFPEYAMSCFSIICKKDLELAIKKVPILINHFFDKETELLFYILERFYKNLEYGKFLDSLSIIYHSNEIVSCTLSNFTKNMIDEECGTLGWRIIFEKNDVNSNPPEMNIIITIENVFTNESYIISESELPSKFVILVSMIKPYLYPKRDSTLTLVYKGLKLLSQNDISKQLLGCEN